MKLFYRRMKVVDRGLESRFGLDLPVPVPSLDQIQMCVRKSIRWKTCQTNCVVIVVTPEGINGKVNLIWFLTAGCAAAQCCGSVLQRRADQVIHWQKGEEKTASVHQDFFCTSNLCGWAREGRGFLKKSQPLLGFLLSRCLAVWSLTCSFNLSFDADCQTAAPSLTMESISRCPCLQMDSPPPVLWLSELWQHIFKLFWFCLCFSTLWTCSCILSPSLLETLWRPSSTICGAGRLIDYIDQ